LEEENRRLKKMYAEEKLKAEIAREAICSGLMILDTNLGGKIHLTEVFNDNEKKNIQS
jgi:hypothetical protein